jgi:hypothetical protein
MWLWFGVFAELELTALALCCPPVLFNHHSRSIALLFLNVLLGFGGLGFQPSSVLMQPQRA